MVQTWVAMEPQQVSDRFRNSFIWVSENGVYPCIPPLHGQFDLFNRFFLNGGRFPWKLDESGLSGPWVRGSATADSNAEQRHRGCAGNSPSKAKLQQAQGGRKGSGQKLIMCIIYIVYICTEYTQTCIYTEIFLSLQVYI